MAVAHYVGEKSQLAHGAAALARQAGQRQAGFGVRPLQQAVAKRHDVVGDGFEQRSAPAQRQGPVGVECSGRQSGCALDFGAAAETEARFGDFGVGAGIEGTLTARGALYAGRAYQHFTGQCHEILVRWEKVALLGGPRTDWSGCSAPRERGAETAVAAYIACSSMRA